MLVLFGGEKGGTGKSTLATNVAVYLATRGEDVMLVDTDPQGSASSWAAVRAENKELAKVHCMAKVGDITDALLDLGSRYGHVIVDAGGRDSLELRSAIAAVDLFYMPIKASQFDLWTASRIHSIVSRMKVVNRKLRARAIIQMAPTNPQINEAAAAQQMLADFPELELSKVIVRERKVYRDAAMDGKGVLEMDNDKAVAEVEALAGEIFDAASMLAYVAPKAKKAGAQ